MEMDIAMNTQHILVLTGPDYEDLELWYPKLRLLEAGRTVTVAATEAGATYHGKNGYPCISDACIHDINSQDYHGLILPGGWMPDKLRREPKALELVREFNESAKMIAAICHGGWIAISAGVYHGVKATGSLGIKDDLINAGATWVDEPVVVDRHFISSRKPEDLPAFCKGIFQVLEATIG